MNIILIVIDALRSDHLSAAGYKRKTSPNIDKIIGGGVFFRNCITPIPRTSPAVASMLTGLYPHSHELRFLYTTKLNPNTTTLAETLKAHGYRTAGHAIELNETGLERGFDVFNPIGWRIFNKLKRSAKKLLLGGESDPDETLTQFGINQINKMKEGKFFLYLHYMGLHWPYQPPDPYAEMFDEGYNGDHNFNKPDDRHSRGELIFNNNLPKRENDHAVAHYDGAIRFVDDQIGKIISHLEKNSLMENTLLIITSDHGEGFGEHNIYFEHGEYLYDETLIVPLIIYNKKLPKIVLSSQAQLTDIVPTVLDFLEIPIIDQLDGVSLISMIKSGKVARKYSFAETERSYYKQNKGIHMGGINGKWRMARTCEWKLIFIPHPNNDIYELYNLKSDPEEKINLYESEQNVAAELKEELFRWIKDKRQDDKSIDLTEKSKNLLRKLGYME